MHDTKLGIEYYLSSSQQLLRDDFEGGGGAFKKGTVSMGLIGSMKPIDFGTGTKNQLLLKNQKNIFILND